MSETKKIDHNLMEFFESVLDDEREKQIIKLILEENDPEKIIEEMIQFYNKRKS